MARRLLSVASLSSATIALVAGSVAPAFAVDATPSAEATATTEATEAPLVTIAGADETVDSAAASLAADVTAELQPGYVVKMLDADGNITGFQNISEEDLTGLRVVTNPDAQDVKVGDTLTAGLDRSATNGVLKTLGDNISVAGTWSSSNDKVFTVDSNGKVTAVGEGTATLTFTVSFYDPGSPLHYLSSKISVTQDITVGPAEQTPAPVETTPAPVETTPAPVETTPAPAQTTEAAAPAPAETTEGAAPAAPVEAAPAPAVDAAPAQDAAAPAAEAAPATDNDVAVATDTTSESGVYYQNCRAVWDALGRPIYANEDGYAADLDANNDGVGCEEEPDCFNDDTTSYSDASYSTPVYSTDSYAYDNCTIAEANGTQNLTSSDYGWGPSLDRDNDGVGCENSNSGYYAADGTYYDSSYDELAYTGFDSADLALAGLGLLAVGGAAIVYRGRHFAK